MRYQPPPHLIEFGQMWKTWINGFYKAATGDLVPRPATTGITASATSVQGGSPLTAEYNEISTCTTIGDSVTLPPAAVGLVVTIINNGAASADVFPASGDNLGAGANTAAALASGSAITYFAYSTTNWKAI
jgi:hypothetical protein